MRLIEKSDIENWAKRFDSKGDLPILISKLVRSTTQADTFADFPSGSAVFIGGWDGTVNCKLESSYVPQGTSLWEFGTEANCKGKADEDYGKRTLDPLGYDISQSTFVFVTPRFWQFKDKWRAAKLRDGKWKDIRVYDSSNLEQWIDESEAVQRWFSGFVSKYPSDGIITIEVFWEEWSLGPLGNLPPQIVTAGRETESQQLLTFLNDTPSIKGIRATSKDEAVAFIIASAKLFEDQHKDLFFSKSLIIDTSSNFRSIRINTNKLNLIARFEEPQVLYSAAAKGHHVLVPLGPDDTFNQETIRLPIIDRGGQIAALIQMGLTNDEAEKYSKEAGRNITILKRLLKFSQNNLEWLKSENVREMIPAMLLGRWNENKKGDREIIEKLSGESYDQYIAKLSRWKSVEEPPLIQIGELWRLTSPLDAWANLSPFLTKIDLEKLKECFLTAFSNGNPIAVASSEREQQIFNFNQEKTYSAWIRDGITQSLILIGLYGEGLKIPNMPDPQLWVDEIIYTLLYKADGDLWVSVDHELPLISEASPDSFFKAVSESLASENKPIMNMFVEEKGFIDMTSFHTGLLWALEGLAWMPEHLYNVSIILSQLTSIDPGGRLSNRPFNSLTEIFRPWHYQTFANYDDRISALQQIGNNEKETAWLLFLRLLPDNHGIAHHTHKMRWRTSDKNVKLVYTWDEINKTYSAVLDLLFLIFDGSDHKLSLLIDKTDNLSQSDRDKVLQFANSFYLKISQNGNETWHEIRKILAHHRSHPDTNWALPEQELLKFESLYYKLEPTNTLDKYVWLFNDNWPAFPEGKVYKENDNNSANDVLQKIDSKRREALASILNEYGIEQIAKLSETVKEPWVLGDVLANIIDATNMTYFVVELINNENKNTLKFIHGFLSRKSILNDLNWLINLYDHLLGKGYNSKILAQIFVAVIPSRALWEFIDNTPKDTREGYWLNVYPYFFNITTEEKCLGITYLITYRRFYSAIKMCSFYPNEIPANLIVEALVKAATQEASEDVSFESYDIGRLFDVLDKKSDVDHNTLINLEWLYMPILSRYASNRTPKNLHEELGKNPIFFMEILKWLYMPKNSNLKEIERANISNENLQNRAKQAYLLLDSWETVPGTDLEGKIDSNYLNNWVSAVRSLAHDCDRVEVADAEIGQILAQYPEKDLNWPPDEICNVIESINTDSIKNNFSTATFNKRGSSSRGPFDGGNIERGHASYFHQLYLKHKLKHPNLAAIFNNMSKRYTEDAKKMDEIAERDRLEY